MTDTKKPSREPKAPGADSDTNTGRRAPSRIVAYDTTLRDGMAREGLTLSLLDKVHIAQQLYRFGIPYIEGGYPGSNLKESEFFAMMRDDPAAQALVAFGSTRRKNTKAAKDAGIRALLNAGTSKVCIFGKTWDFHVKVALETTEKENLAMIADSVRTLKQAGREVVYDAEHFFDGYFANPRYAVETLHAAAEAGADYLVLCDTNGGTLPSRVAFVVRELAGLGMTNLGIHTHNDIGCAVASTLAAVEEGCVMVQGTMNGLGERTGNADLTAIIPTLEIKMGRRVLPKGRLAKLTEVSHYVTEVTNLHHNAFQPYVGKSAFAHKGGAHGSAMRRNAKTYEHIDPSLVGNTRRMVVSEIAGRSMLLDRAATLGLDFSGEQLEHLLERIKTMEYQGYTYEAADASLALMLLREAGRLPEYFRVLGYDVHLHRRSESDTIMDATVKVEAKGERVITAAEGNGPVHALDCALRRGLEPLFPELRAITLLDYKVRILETTDGTDAVTRVLIETGNEHETWGTVGVSENLIMASWAALYDSLIYGLYLERNGNGENAKPASRRRKRKS